MSRISNRRGIHYVKSSGLHTNLWPLGSNADLIATIAGVTGEPQSRIADRLLAEHRAIGTNVCREINALGLTPWCDSEGFAEFYRSNDAFLYETSVWNRFRAKDAMRHWLAESLVTETGLQPSVLIVGDGLGIDSLFLSRLGAKVTCVDPSESGREFAAHIHRYAGVSVRLFERLADIDHRCFDAVVCLDVLEHVIDPPAMIRAMIARLRVDGAFYVHAPFYLVDAARPTHLRSNVKYSGCLSLFEQAGLKLAGGSFFWNPILFRKSDRRGSLGQTAICRLGGLGLSLGRLIPTFVGGTASALIRKPNRYVGDLLDIVDSHRCSARTAELATVSNSPDRPHPANGVRRVT